MKWLLPVCVTALLLGCARAPQPQVKTPLMEIGGVLTADTRLDGHYLLVADLHVPGGVTLSIAPGTLIEVQPSDSTKIDPEYLSRETEILVRGELLAYGTAERPIVMRPTGTDPRAISWAGIAFVQGARGDLAHLRIEQAEAGILCLDAAPQLRSVTVLRSRYGILLQKQSTPLLQDVVLADGEAGLFCWDQSAPQLRNSQILNHQEEGLYLGRDCRGEFSGNLIASNDRGVVLPAGRGLAASNRLQDNRQDLIHYAAEVSP